jgi:26S proteasome non-ATPase regulatory subunit 9
MAVTKESLKKLIQEKDDMEKEIQDLINTLDRSPVGRSGSLVDKEGFPRADIDINAIRTQRNRLACLQNDHIALMKKIERDMSEYHQSLKELEQSTMEKGNNVQKVEETKPSADVDPFAIVNSVAPDSPASACGLKKGDKILQFGYITRRQVDQNGFNILSSAVEANLGKKMPIKVLREDSPSVIDLVLTPKSWSGRGYLGCHLLPMAK